MKKNLIRMYVTAIGMIISMACFCACSKPEKLEKIEKVERIQTIDSKAPEGTLKTWFLTASNEVIPGDFTENVSDESDFVEGFRSVQLICDDPINFELQEPEWSAQTDCYEEQNVSIDTLQASFSPEKDGLYSMEVVGADIYGNASVAKVYVLYVTEAEEPQWLQESQMVQEEKLQSGFDRGKAEEAFAQVNQQRNANGVPDLVWNESLYELACTRAQEITVSFSHQRPDGSYVGDVMIRQYGASGCGENIAENYQSVTNLMNGWLSSSGHKENMLDGRFTSGVMACYRQNGNYYWVNLFQQ